MLLVCLPGLGQLQLLKDELKLVAGHALRRTCWLMRCFLSALTKRFTSLFSGSVSPKPNRTFHWLMSGLDPLQSYASARQQSNLREEYHLVVVDGFVKS